MVKIDVGCGYDLKIHYPDQDSDIHLDPYLFLSSKDFLEKLNNPIIGSAQNLPFRNNVFDYFICRAVLEHLPKPYKAINESWRCLKNKGVGEFIIPIIVNHFKHYFYLMFISFPFGYLEIIHLIKRMRRNIKRYGLEHISNVKPKHITRFFGQYEVFEHHYRSKIFYGKTGRLLKKILRLKREPIKDIQGYYVVMGRK